MLPDTKLAKEVCEWAALFTRSPSLYPLLNACLWFPRAGIHLWTSCPSWPYLLWLTLNDMKAKFKGSTSGVVV
jgi:hypothetical protein